MKWFTKSSTVVFSSLLLALSLPYARADMIDFETGFTDRQPVGVVVTGTNSVTFSIGHSSPAGTAFIAEVGGDLTAFIGADTDKPDGGVGGNFSLTDDDGAPYDSFNYFINFATPVTHLSLNLYDGADGGPLPGDTATLTAYESSGFSHPVGTAIFTVVAGMPDGVVALLDIPSPTGVIRSASLTFSEGDVGNAIDNVSFSTLTTPAPPDPAQTPEPGTWMLMGTGLAALLGYGWKRRPQES